MSKKLFRTALFIAFPLFLIATIDARGALTIAEFAASIPLVALFIGALCGYEGFKS